MHRQSIAKSVSKVLAEANIPTALAQFSNQQSNPLYGLQSVGTSQAPFAAGPAPAQAPQPISVNTGTAPGAHFLAFLSSLLMYRLWLLKRWHETQARLCLVSKAS